MHTNDIRRLFLDFFEARGHTIVPSSPLLPAHDPTLLFTNAGMVQFKETFLGNQQRPYQRATTAQRCVRAGGKHNDLDNVGYTERHHTFFEMLGNFSFGDYFKNQAIHYCWELLTGVMQLPAESLWVTVHDGDTQAERIWLDEIGIDRNRFSRCGDDSNFWSMGDVGPCGPCSEVFYDHGPLLAGGPPGSPDEDGDRYIEIWNLVFMQYNRDASGTLHPLPRPSVDTGMGLERIAAVLQGVHSNYHIDVFKDLISAAAALAQVDACATRYADATARDTTGKAIETSLRVIADHIRACAFLIADGVIPSNEEQGYVLRRIIRRAIRHARRLTRQQPFFWRMVGPLAAAMGDAHSELHTQCQHIERTLLQEEELFAKTLDQGMERLSRAIAAARNGVLSGATVFKLYDTYGLPADLTADVAREHALQVDWESFEHSMQQQRLRARGARTAQQRAMDQPSTTALDVGNLPPTHFCGYQRQSDAATVIALYDANGARVEHLEGAVPGCAVLDATPFYAEAGGQVGDRGNLQHAEALFAVDDTQKQNGIIVHSGGLKSGRLHVGARITASVDRTHRCACARNHSATHLLHAALCQIIGTHVQQKGSLVEPLRLRFDFSHHQPLSNEEMFSIEHRVNEWILANTKVSVEMMPLKQAQQSGAVALFGEKYSDPVRVLRIGEASTELCGGTHVNRSGDIGLFKLTDESGIAAGVRRLQAVSGHQALLWLSETNRQMERIAAVLQSDKGRLVERLEALVASRTHQDKQLQVLQNQLSAAKADELLQQAITIKGVQVLSARLDNVTNQQLRDTLDRLKRKLKSALIVLASVTDGKVTLIAGVTKDTCDRLSAKTLINFVAPQLNGRGGGRDDLAQAGSHDPSHLDQVLKTVATWATEQLGTSKKQLR